MLFAIKLILEYSYYNRYRTTEHTCWCLAAKRWKPVERGSSDARVRVRWSAHRHVSYSNAVAPAFITPSLSNGKQRLCSRLFWGKILEWCTAPAIQQPGLGLSPGNASSAHNVHKYVHTTHNWLCALYNVMAHIAHIGHNRVVCTIMCTIMCIMCLSKYIGHIRNQSAC